MVRLNYRALSPFQEGHPWRHEWVSAANCIAPLIESETGNLNYSAPRPRKFAPRTKRRREKREKKCEQEIKKRRNIYIEGAARSCEIEIRSRQSVFVPATEEEIKEEKATYWLLFILRQASPSDFPPRNHLSQPFSPF